MARYDPFNAGVEPLNSLDTIALFPLALRRSMMWDMVADAMIKDPERFGENPASDDVVEAEFREMVDRNRMLNPFGPGIEMYCQLAAAAATNAVLAIEPKAQGLSDEEREEFLAENTRISTMVTRTVLGHMLHKGLIHVGAHQ
jgi:hypothetical protein